MADIQRVKSRLASGLSPSKYRRCVRKLAIRSTLVPPYVRKTKTLQAAIPWLYLKGISTGEMGAALKVLLGANATGFSAKTVARLKTEWAAEYQQWRQDDLS